MDINIVLENARIALKLYREAASAELRQEAADNLADAFEAMDQWFIDGGFVPTAWDNTYAGCQE